MFDPQRYAEIRVMMASADLVRALLYAKALLLTGVLEKDAPVLDELADAAKALNEIADRVRVNSWWEKSDAV